MKPKARRATALVCALFAATGLGRCVSYVDLQIRLQARAAQEDPLLTYFDDRTGLRFTDKAAGVRRRVIFLTGERLRDYIRRLYPAGRKPQGLPPARAVEMHFLNYGRTPIRIDYYDFIIREKDGAAEYAALRPRRFDRRLYGRGLGGLPYAWAFEQKDSFAYHLPVPDWYGAAVARRTGSPLEFAQRREQAWRRLAAGHAERTLILPGREVKGIALFELLPPDRDYVLEYRGKAGGGFAFRPFHFRVKLVRGGKPVSDSNLRRRVWRAFQRDRNEVDQETAELMRMHEQLREHDRLRRR